LLPRREDDRRSRGLRRLPGARPDRGRQHAHAAVGSVVTRGRRLDGGREGAEVPASAAPERGYQSGTLEPEGVRTMFDGIARVYDVMNRVMTVGLDRRWRRAAVQAVVQPGFKVLDACCGTGDLAIAAEREGGIVTGLDFSGEMLVRARRK